MFLTIITVLTVLLALAFIGECIYSFYMIKHLRLRISCLNGTYEQIFRRYINASDRAVKLTSDVEQLQTLNKQLTDDLIQREKECKDRLQQLKKAEEHIVILRYELQKISNDKNN